MSIVSLQIGQCGNQIGAEFFDTIYHDCISLEHSSIPDLNRTYVRNSLDTFFNENSNGKFNARCIQLDTEEKVIDCLRKKTNPHKWSYFNNCFYTAKCGSGNNWAFGYFMHGDKIKEKLEILVQNQLECCDSLDGLLVSMSLAGGTGSGVGTKLLTQLPDILPKTPVLTQLIWPYRRGEVSVQSYNAVLSLGHLLDANTAQSLDAFLMHHNDTLHKICSNRLLASDPNFQVGMHHLNALVSHQVAGVLQPSNFNLQVDSFTSKRRLSSLLLDLCGHPDYRLLRIRCLPYMAKENRQFCTETWPQLARHGRQMLLTGSAAEDKLDWSVTSSGAGAQNRFENTRLPLLSFVAVLRGNEALEHVQKPTNFVHDLSHNLINKNSFSVPSPTYSFLRGHSRHFGGYPRSLFVVSNGGGPRLNDLDSNLELLASASAEGDTVASLKYISSRAWELFASRAYFHQYERYGLTSDMFMDCVAVIEQNAHNYSTLSWV